MISENKKPIRIREIAKNIASNGSHFALLSVRQKQLDGLPTCLEAFFVDLTADVFNNCSFWNKEFKI